MCLASPRDEDGGSSEALQPKRMMNPLTQRVFQCISSRALSPSSILPDMDPGLAQLLEPRPQLMAGCARAMDSVRVSDIHACL